MFVCKYCGSDMNPKYFRDPVEPQCADCKQAVFNIAEQLFAIFDVKQALLQESKRVKKERVRREVLAEKERIDYLNSQMS